MKKTVLLVLAFAVAASCALPTQAQTSTNCTVIGNQVQCYSTGVQQYQATPNTAFLGLLLRRRAERRAQAEADAYAQYRRDLGILIQRGRCDLAKEKALAQGDIELAATIPGLCKTEGTPPTP